MLAGCGNVCIRRTAHRSTHDDGSCPSVGSRHSTNKSLHNMPMSDRGFNSGARHSTCTIEASPCALIASNDIVVLRTTRVKRSGPSIMRRLDTWSAQTGSIEQQESHTDAVEREGWEIYPVFWIAIVRAFDGTPIPVCPRSCYSPKTISQLRLCPTDRPCIRTWEACSSKAPPT